MRNALRAKGIKVHDDEQLSAHGVSGGVIDGDNGGDSDDINGAVILLIAAQILGGELLPMCICFAHRVIAGPFGR